MCTSDILIDRFEEDSLIELAQCLNNPTDESLKKAAKYMSVVEYLGRNNWVYIDNGYFKSDDKIIPFEKVLSWITNTE